MSFITTGIDDFSITTTFNESVEKMTYSAIFNFTHDVVIDAFGGQRITDNCFLNTALSKKAVKFQCMNIDYNNFYVVEFNGTITLSTNTFPLNFIITFGKEQQASNTITGSYQLTSDTKCL